jgi:alcohol dehydrogenase
VRALVFYEHGGPEVLRVEADWPEPSVGPGQVLVAVEACALNRADIFEREGMPGLPIELPHIPGGDVAGVVTALGPGVTGVAVGARVLIDPNVDYGDGRRGALGYPLQGGLCEYVAVPAANLLPLPPTVSFEQAAALPIAYGTAHRMLFTRGQVRAGETVVVLGASGGVGVACVQLAVLAGATVIAVASAPWKLERLRALGAAHTVLARGGEYGAEVWRLTERRGADVIVDYSGRVTWPTSLRTLRRGGRLLVCGATSGYEVPTDLRYVWTREATILGANGWERRDLETLLGLVAAGRLAPVIDRVVPLAGAIEAYRAIEAREVFGKVIVRPRL